MPDMDTSFAKDPSDILRIMMLTGSIVGMISVFMTWFGMDFWSVRFDYTGYELFSRQGGRIGSGYFQYVPLAALAVSAASVVPAVLSFTKYERKCAAIGVGLGLLILLSVLLYLIHPGTEMTLSSAEMILAADIKPADHIGAGVYSAVISGIFLILGGATALVRKRENSENGSE